jgi:hypothetical protein
VATTVTALPRIAEGGLTPASRVAILCFVVVCSRHAAHSCARQSLGLGAACQAPPAVKFELGRGGRAAPGLADGVAGWPQGPESWGTLASSDDSESGPAQARRVNTGVRRAHLPVATCDHTLPKSRRPKARRTSQVRAPGAGPIPHSEQGAPMAVKFKFRTAELPAPVLPSLLQARGRVGHAGAAV